MKIFTRFLLLSLPAAAVTTDWVNVDPQRGRVVQGRLLRPDPGAGGGDNYWLYPMQTDTLVNNSVSANYYDGDFVGSGTAVFPTGNALTDVGAYAGQESFYGTLDQGGNVREWNDAVLALSRGARGGSWNGEGNGLRVFFRGSDGPSNEDYGLGFRVACVPEPGVSLLCTLAGGLVLRRRRR